MSARIGAVVGPASALLVVLNLCACRPPQSPVTTQLPEGFGSAIAPRELPTVSAEELGQSRSVRRCDRGTCAFDARFEGSAQDERAPAKMAPWIIEPGSTVRVERGEHDVLAMVVAGSVIASTPVLDPTERNVVPDQRVGAWTALRSANRGMTLFVDATDPPALVVIVLARDAPASTEPMSDAPSPSKDMVVPRAQALEVPLQVRPLAAIPWLTWGGGAFRAKIAFEGADAPRASLGVLVGGARSSVAEHVHDGSYELLTAIVSDGMVTVAPRGEGQLGHQNVVRPGDPQVIPAGARHAWQPAGTLPLVAVQAYAPGGPEQRFRALAR